jgi:hypothetical protein
MARDPLGWDDADAADEAARHLFARFADSRSGASCPRPELVQAARIGVLPGELQARVTAHVDNCRLCQVLGEALDDPTVADPTPAEQARILQRIQGELGKSTRRSGAIRMWQLVAAAAAVAVLIAGTVWVWQSRSVPSSPAVPKVAARTRQPAPSVFQLQKPALRPPAAGDLVWRGSGDSGKRDPFVKVLEAYRKDDFTEAERLLRELVRRQPNSATAQFYLGVTELFLRHDDEAVRVLQTAERLASADAALHVEASWYLAVAYYRTGRIEEAKGKLETLCRSQSRRVMQSCAGIRELAGPITLTGAVTTRDGAPLVGARVGELRVQIGPDVIVASPTDHITTTDAAGRFSISDVRTQVLQVFKDGYFTTGKAITTITQDTQIDFSMDPWEFTALGETVRRTIKPGDMTCGDPDEFCHRFALKVPSDGTLDVVLDSPSPGTLAPRPGQYDAVRNWDLHLETPQGDAYGPPLGTSIPLRLSIPVERGATYQIRVLSYGDAARQYELRTQLR